MKILETGDTFYGKDYTDLINKTLGTSLSNYMRSCVELDELGLRGVVAWFVHMDGSTNGYVKWLWQNYLSEDGNTIDEHNVNKDKRLLRSSRAKESFLPYRLAFELHKNKNVEGYYCKFVGAFKLDCFIGVGTQLDVRYTKVLDKVTMREKFEKNAKTTTRNDFFGSDARYTAPIEKMEFSDKTYQTLKKYNVNTVREVLEVGWGETQMTDEVIDKVQRFFHITNKQ